jgi:ubiquinone/menaquinone biosynthesis C-methylase UbiE
MSSLSSVDTAAAEAYERYLVPPVFGPWAEYVVDIAAPRRGEHALDVGCGTGVATRIVANRTGRAAGIDIDPAMIEVARRDDEIANDRIDWRCADACRLDFADAEFDLCLCIQGLQHFVDREQALKEIRRVLKPSGRFVAAVWARIDHTPGLLAILHALEAEHIDASAFRRPFALGDPDALEDLVKCAGFNTVEVRRHEMLARFASIDAFLFALRAGSAASRAALEHVSRDRWSAFAAQVQQRMTQYVGADGVEFPYRAHIVCAVA